MCVVRACGGRAAICISGERMQAATQVPFAAPPVIVFDLPVPPSVNRTRRIDMRSLRLVNEWKQSADRFVFAQRRQQPRTIIGQFELLVIFSEAHTKADLDNTLKSLIDYLRRIQAVRDDSPQYMRRIIVEWGDAPEGCRVHIRGLA